MARRTSVWLRTRTRPAAPDQSVRGQVGQTVFRVAGARPTYAQPDRNESPHASRPYPLRHREETEASKWLVLLEPWYHSANSGERSVHGDHLVPKVSQY